MASSFINDDEGWLADNNGKLFHTKDGGESWDSISVAKNFLKLCFTDILNGFALSSDAAYKTTDGGVTWSSLLLPGIVGNAIYFSDKSTGFISGYQMIFKTLDGGETWSAVFAGDVSFLDCHFTTPSIGIAVAYDDGLYRCVWRTEDGGLTWSNVFNERNYFMSSVFFLNEDLGWAAGYYDEAGMGKEPAILNTTDGGLTWKENYRNKEILGSGQPLIDIRFSDEMNGFAISRFSLDVFTADGGATWNLTHESDTLGLSPLFGVYKSLDGHDNIYLIGADGIVTKSK